MKALAWTPELSIKEYPSPPIPKGWVFGKVIFGMISTLDNSFKAGLPIPLGRIAGSYGVLRVLEAGIDSGAEDGRVYGVVPYSKAGVLGIDIDGLMGSYASVPSDSLIKLEGKQSGELNELLPLWLEFSYIPHLKEAIKDSVNPLILGCNFTTYIIASNLRETKDITVGCFSNDFLKKISELGVKAINISKSSERGFDFVILGVLSSYHLMNVFNYLGDYEELRIYLPPDIPAVFLKLPDTSRKVVIERAKFSDPQKGLKALKNVPGEVLKKNVAVTKELKEIPHLVRRYPRIIWVATS